MLRPPPASAVHLLQALLPRSMADDVAANMEDLHARRARQHGQASADLWYWRQAFVLPLRLWLAPSMTMTSILHDLRHAIRFHRAHPAPAAVAILSLTLGIGLSTAIFSIVDGVLLRPAPVPSLDRLAMVWETDRATGTVREPGSLPDFLDFRSRARSLDSLGAFIATEHVLTAPSGEPTRVPTLLVSPEMQDILGIRPLMGRLIVDSDVVPPGRRVTLISESLWSREFNRQPSAVGSVIRVNNAGVEIVGVVPDRSDFGVLQILGGAAYSRAFADRGVPVRVDLWRPLTEDTKQLPRSTHPVLMVGRLEQGSDFPRIQEELSGIAADLEKAYPQDNDQRGVMVEPLRAVVFGSIEPVFLALLGAVVLVLLVASVNVASLLLAQQAGRRREVAVRMALGAGGGRLVRQFLTEAIALAAIATLGGVALAYGSLGWLISQAPAGIPRLAEAHIDGRVLTVTVFAGALVAVLFGLLPALQALGARPQLALGSSSRSATTASRRLRRTLVVCEIAIACVLVVGCGLLLKSFWRVYAIDLGFDRAGVVKAEFLLPASRYPMPKFPQAPEITRFVTSVVERAESLPGVESAAVTAYHPFDPGFTNSFTVVGREAEAGSWPEISIRPVSAGYFETLRLSLVRGRLLERTDVAAAPEVAVINQAAADRFFDGRDPLGQQLQWWGSEKRIVGIVENEKFQGITAPSPLAAYVPFEQSPRLSGSLLVRSAGGQQIEARDLVRLIREQDAELPVFGAEGLTDAMSRSVAARRFASLLLVLFAVTALALAALGVHGLLSYDVAQRTREFGIRLALGARPGALRRDVTLEALRLAVPGLAIGLAGALVASRLATTLLYSVTPADPMVYITTGAVLIAVATFASAGPAWRATRIVPGETLRDAE